MASSITNFIGKRRNRSSGNSSGEKGSSPENKKPKNSADDLTVDGNASEDEEDEVITALEMTGDVHSKLEWIINKLKKLDDIEISVKNIESTLTALEERTKKLEDFKATASQDLEVLKQRCSFLEGKCLTAQKAIDQHGALLAELQRKDLESQALTQALHTKDLYLEAYSRRENIKFNNIREEVEREDTEEVLRNFLENEIGLRDARSVEIQRVHRLGKKKEDSRPRPILARFLRYKDCENILALGHRLRGTNYQMFTDLPSEIVKRRKEQMPTLKRAKQRGIPASFSRAEPDKLYIRGKFWPAGKTLEIPDE